MTDVTRNSAGGDHSASTTPNGALLSCDTQGRRAAWQNIEIVTTSPASIPALEEALYDGEGQRVVQIAESNGMHTTAAPMAPAQRTLTLRHGRRGPPDASAPDVTEVSAPQQLCRPK